MCHCYPYHAGLAEGARDPGIDARDTGSMSIRGRPTPSIGAERGDRGLIFRVVVVSDAPRDQRRSEVGVNYQFTGLVAGY
jgi:hypothetical protein